MIDFKNDIDNCLEILEKGGIILYPTDTIWGIGCDATNANAVENIIQLKNRSANKSFVVLISNENNLNQYTTSFDEEILNYLNNQQQPTTVIYANAKGLAKNVLATDGSVAIRICKDLFCKTLIERFKKPIVSTSANISNELSPENFASIHQSIKSGVDYVVSHRQNETTKSSPSSIIKWENGKIIVIR